MKKYEASGVSIQNHAKFIQFIKNIANSNNIGSYAGLFPLNIKDYKNPILVSSTDGVGTKLKLAILSGKHDTVGIDLVAMSVNDIITCGAKPLFFLDYIAVNKLEPKILENVIKGIVEGCKQSDCLLIGGETAQMSDMYKTGDYDLAGFAVGIVEKEKLITGEKIKPGNCVIGLASSGIHSNGYTLARKIFFEDNKYNFNEYMSELNDTLINVLMTPTIIYTNIILKLVDKFSILGLAHITGGGFIHNIPRILPQHIACEIYRKNFPRVAIFEALKQIGNIEEEEMYSVFNMGIGFIVITEKDNLNDIVRICNENKIKAMKIGEIVERKDKSVLII
jgi:phosphoribosylformylglycinamidine cyclo-ligase